MRVFNRGQNKASKLGRYHDSWIRNIIDPLSVRERIIYGFALLATIVILIVPQVIATESLVGTPLLIGSTECSATGDWQFPERATGTSPSTEGINGVSPSIDSSASN